MSRLVLLLLTSSLGMEEVSWRSEASSRHREESSGSDTSHTSRSGLINIRNVLKIFPGPECQFVCDVVASEGRLCSQLTVLTDGRLRLN